MVTGARPPGFHKVFTFQNVARLSLCCPKWVCILTFDHTCSEPAQRLLPSSALPELFERRSLCPASLVAGLGPAVCQVRFVSKFEGQRLYKLEYTLRRGPASSCGPAGHFEAQIPLVGRLSRRTFQGAAAGSLHET